MKTIGLALYAILSMAFVVMLEVRMFEHSILWNAIFHLSLAAVLICTDSYPTLDIDEDQE